MFKVFLKQIICFFYIFNGPVRKSYAAHVKYIPSEMVQNNLIFHAFFSRLIHDKNVGAPNMDLFYWGPPMILTKWVAIAYSFCSFLVYMLHKSLLQFSSISSLHFFSSRSILFFHVHLYIEQWWEKSRDVPCLNLLVSLSAILLEVSN